MTGNIKTMLFDLDGTILDTNELIIRSFIESLDGYVPEGFGRDHIIPIMGNPLTEQLRGFSGLEDVTKLVVAYREVNHRLHDEYVTAFDNVNEVITKLHKYGIQIGIVTTKIRLTTVRGLKHTGLYEEVDAIVTIEDVEHPKPHPEPVNKAIELLGADPASTIMIGDSMVDMQSAVAAGVIPVGVAWSLKGELKLKEAGAQHVIKDMRELYNFAGLERD